jgi:N6-L-threonylcarbamoyladenine synthase
MNAFAIRLASESDLDAIMRLENESFASDAWSIQNMHDELVGAERFYVVAFSTEGASEELIGYAGLAKSMAAAHGDIQTIAVNTKHRGKGLGRELMNRLIAECVRVGIGEVFLEVRADNPVAEALYKSLGFEQIDLRKRYYQPDDVDAVVMRLTIAQQSKAEPLVLGIESSCDETGIGIVRGNTLLANVISSSMAMHVRFGGVVPEVAARAHLEALTPTLHEALAKAKVSLEEIDAIAVTNGPGLAGALMVGIAAAKALAVSLDKPIYAVNHLVGHVGVDILERGKLETPTIALLVSGGHTSLLLVRDLLDDVELLGETIDDAAGEAFDKGARVLGLGYPGGPELSALAEQGNPEACPFTTPLTGRADLAFSFSGLKTALSMAVTAGDHAPADLAAAYQEAIVAHLLDRARLGLAATGRTTLGLVGGVAANERLRARLPELPATVVAAPLAWCGDNAAMIATAAANLPSLTPAELLGLDAHARSPLG